MNTLIIESTAEGSFVTVKRGDTGAIVHDAVSRRDLAYFLQGYCDVAGDPEGAIIKWVVTR